MIELLNFINAELEKVNVPYEFGEWTSNITDLYFVGEYSEFEPSSESGQEDKTFILNGFTRRSALALEEMKEKIKTVFPPIEGKTAILDDGSGVAVFYSNSFPVPTGEEGLYRLQVNLSIKYWKVV